MEINIPLFLNNLKEFRQNVRAKDKQLEVLWRLSPMSDNYMEMMVQYLSRKILLPDYTEIIRDHFSSILFMLVTKAFPIDDATSNNCSDSILIHKKKCIALGKLVSFSQDIKKYALHYFSNAPSPFSWYNTNNDAHPPPTKKQQQQEPTDLDISICCYNFLISDPNFYKNKWRWSEFLQLYFQKGCNQQQFFCNNIFAILTNMTSKELMKLNENIAPENLVANQTKSVSKSSVAETITENPETHGLNSDSIIWTFKSDTVVNVEGVLLTIFNLKNHKYYESDQNHSGEIVLVESTKSNLRKISMSISFEKIICLSGPVGCGKTILIEYLAKKTGRFEIPKNKIEYNKNGNVTPKIVQTISESNEIGKKRKSSIALDNNFISSTCESEEELNKSHMTNNSCGFLRIQLGDQTDSKMLLGQYRCTDIPGEFVWQPGVLTQAVMNGCWLLMEDIDQATQEVCIVLSNLMENNYLSVPGFSDRLEISPGFQLFVTLRSQKQSLNFQKSTFQLLEKYVCIVNIEPLSRNELSQVICKMYPKFKSIDQRMVDVFLAFSSGCHDVNDDKNEETVLPFIGESGVDLNAIKQRLSSSNRLVSTRDLIKWCERSYPKFSDSSSDYSFFVFQNAVDLFCSYLPQGTIKTQLIVNVGAKLNISIGKCESFANDYSPNVTLTTDDISVGRVKLSRYGVVGVMKEYSQKRGLSKVDKNDGGCKKKIKTNTDEYLSVYQINKEKLPTFSFTRIAKCILERIAVAVQQNEPLLLVGETGVGKTSSIQYLSYQTNHKLVVVNMNNQSDVSDLIGGFKPVELSFVVMPIRIEFEYLFKETFNLSKNEKFLNNISICYNRGDYRILIKLMLRIIDTVFAKNLKQISNSKMIDVIVERWTQLKIKLMKLNGQLESSVNISFAFIPGSLINCIKNGDWVLLDEINLATSETLECLSTILEPFGSIVLLEKGDYVPIKRHPDFRIFACMNPSTDVGKKDLSVGIRNRFTEFFVDELTNLDDLQTLIRDYLANTGIIEKKLFTIAKLYKKLCALAQLDLNDGVGNRPVYSLRTLCRALSICAKNLCGSVERNLYESFCLSFLTQLDPISHKIVLHLIQEALLGNNVKAILSQPIPKPFGDQLNFEGYWIQLGTKELQECKHYILTDTVRDNLKDLARIISIGKLPILLQGPTSAGKTSLIEYVAKRSGNCCLRINNHEHTDLQEYIGSYTADINGKLTFAEGVLVQAMRNGYWIILDELNLASSDILEALNRVLDDNRELFIPETQTLVKAHSNFMLFATQNPAGLYGGRKTLSRAFKNRFIELHFSDIPRHELEIILENRCQIPKSYAQKMVKTMFELQINRKSNVKSSFTLRDLFRWGNRYAFANSQLLENKLYDWNQHLVDEGYLTLSAKIRNILEVDLIKTALFNNFRKQISVNNLFELSDTTSMVTKSILEKIQQHPKSKNIVWTFNMRRMAVLTAKALEFHEPVLLVGPTGCGKTTICQILADVNTTLLRTLNCHMHIESADFLGGLRPYRNKGDIELAKQSVKQRPLFEWADGPLILSMQEGSYFLADEISLAEDSVLERLNCILEPERTVLLAEKAGFNDNLISSSTKNNLNNNEFIITADKSFQFFATMNPGGDFGKRELSPALRNRFTEIWCSGLDTKDDLIKIAAHGLLSGFGQVGENPQILKNINNLAKIMIETILFIKDNIDKFIASIRDILTWVAYVTQNANIINDKQQSKILTINQALIFGLEIIFLDSLELLPHDSHEQILIRRNNILNFCIKNISTVFNLEINLNDILSKKGSTVDTTENHFGIQPFFIEKCLTTSNEDIDFEFTAPTTRHNLFRLLSALTLNKPILLEGTPGVGKTSLVENLIKAIGFKVVRINLSEHTDLADLFGTDLPAITDQSKTIGDENDNDELNNIVGSFVWCDGPLLAALKTPNTWILLDELNLAPQSVLEGLNAVLDHRGEAFIPELNKTFKLDNETRIFASQNPLRHGGGRKGLPQSFLNRFIKVYLNKLQTKDLFLVVQQKYGSYFAELDILFKKQMNLNEKMIKFSEKLDMGISNLEFGYTGGPFEANLRDILRWCDCLCQSYSINQWKKFDNYDKFAEFCLILYEKMKLVYYQRMRTENDKFYIRQTFKTVFSWDVDELEAYSKDVPIYWTDNDVYFGDVKLSNCNKNNNTNKFRLNARSKTKTPLLLTSQKELLKNLAECVLFDKPVILCGPTDSGKTKNIDLITNLMNRHCMVDTIDESVTGSFQQVDFNRHLDEASHIIQSILSVCIQYYAFQQQQHIRHSHCGRIVDLLNAWENYNQILDTKQNINEISISNEMIHFKKRLEYLRIVATLLQTIDFPADTNQITWLATATNILNKLQIIVQNAETLNAGGHFEWVDSKIVTSFKNGEFICLEHVNLCSSAILDRLNPLFETAGTLLISEKGVALDNEPEIIIRNKEFRAFLTLDPKNGEISRAMRNRCIELNLIKESFTDNDLRQIIYTSGIEHMHLINCLLFIHKRCKNISDFNQFSISHLSKFAQLCVAYQRMGYTDRHAILASATEVYVSSSYLDLLGFGLAFYRNKLKQEIVDQIEQLHEIRNYFNLENVILYSNNMNCLTLIQRQSEIVFATINCGNTNLQTATTEILCNLFSDFKQIQILNKSALTSDIVPYLLWMLYNVSSLNDFKLREMYLDSNLQKLVGSNEQINKYQKLNKKLSNDLLTITKYGNSDLPWNSEIYSRFASHYDGQEMCLSDQLSLGALLMARIILNTDLVLQTTSKITEITAISYSMAITKNIVQDTSNNYLIKNLYSLLQNINVYVELVLNNCDNSIGFTEYVDIICGYLWHNRLFKIAEQRLFKENKNTLNENLINSLTLHYKWMEKHFLNILPQLRSTGEIKNNNFMEIDQSYSSEIKNNNFIKIRQGLQEYIQTTAHPFNLLQKNFVKHFTNYLPFYELNQLELYSIMKNFENLTQLTPAIGGMCPKNELYTRLKALFTKQISEIKLQLINNNNFNSDSINIEYLKRLIKIETKNNFGEITDGLNKFFDKINDESFIAEDKQNQIINIDELIRNVNELNDLNDEQNIKSLNLLIEILPIFEYFALKTLNVVTTDQSQNYTVNLNYFNGISSITLNELSIIKLLSNKSYKVCDSLWQCVLKKICEIVECGTENDFMELIKMMPNDFYQIYSSYDRNLLFKLQTYKMKSIAVSSQICSSSGIIDDNNDRIQFSFVNGPILTESILSMLLKSNGDFKSPALGDLDIWRSTLKTLSQLVWNNVATQRDHFNFEYTNLMTSINYASKLHAEITFLFKKFDNTEFDGEFKKLIEKLLETLIRTHKSIKNDDYQNSPINSKRAKVSQQSSLINAIIGAIELNLISYFPLIDPVEKMQLKKLYTEEEKQHLQNIVGAYDFMKITMDHQRLGNTMLKPIYSKINALETRMAKFSKSVAIRPNKEQNMYINMVKDINNFLQTCQPIAFNNLFKSIELNLTSPTETDLPTINENIKRIDLLISNSEQFCHHTLIKYSKYYQDFVNPIENAISMLKFGLMGLKNSLIRERDLLCMNMQVGGDNNMIMFLENLVEFPNVKGLVIANKIETKDLLSLKQPELTHILLLKTRIKEMQNQLAISSEISSTLFDEFNLIFKTINQFWIKQENISKQKSSEEESIYITKIRCQTEDEEEIIKKEVNYLFPNSIDDDFGDVYQAVVSLEQTKPKQKLQPLINNENEQKLNNDDIKFVYQIFTNMMMHYSQSYYYNAKTNDKFIKQKIDYCELFQTKMKIFAELYQQYRGCLNSRMDDCFYNGIGLAIGINMEEFNLLKLNDSAKISYNFYKDPNIIELMDCMEIMDKITVRVNVELEKYPDHAVLLDIITIIKRIRSFSCDSAVVRFNAGFQMLTKKLSEWNKLAHRNNAMHDLEDEVGRQIQRWMKLELQCWRECLSQSYEKVKSKSYRYWFFVYNLLHEYLDDTLCRNTDRFFDGQDSTPKNEKLNLKDVINALKQFIETSNFAEFHTRINMLKSFEHYLHYLKLNSKLTKRKNTLICILHNLYMYFDQFRLEIDQHIKTILSGIEKKLKEFVKLESYSKYLSYFSQEANIAQVHRKLHKFSKEYEQLLSQKISVVFVLKENQMVDLVQTCNDKGKELRYEAKVKYYMVDVKNFLLSLKMASKYFLPQTELDLSKYNLLSKVEKRFETSRLVIENSISHSNYPNLIYSLDITINDHIETCEYLRKQEVDRKQEKPQQKVQAKQILQLKRKALSDFCKFLATIGISYQTGLMEFNLTGELVDFKIIPFCVETMCLDQKRKRVDQNILYLNEKIDLYWVKCIYKFKLLQTVMLTPNSELGLQNLERIKGFAVDMFLLVQSQRKKLSTFVYDLCELKTQMQMLTDLSELLDNNHINKFKSSTFVDLCEELSQIKAQLCQICDVFQQYELIITCIPDATDTKLTVLDNDEMALNQQSKQCQQIKSLTQQILTKSRKMLLELEKCQHSKFHSVETVENTQRQYQDIVKDIEMVAETYSQGNNNNNNNNIMLIKTVIDLLASLKNPPPVQHENDNASTTNDEADLNEFKDINVELENLLNSVLFSIQEIYKANLPHLPHTADNTKDESFESDQLKEKHLKLHIFNNLDNDVQKLNLKKVTSTLTNILLTIQNSKHDAKLETIKKLIMLLPVLEQFSLLGKFYLIQHIASHNVSSKMLSYMLSVFIELGAKGFCVPPDLMQDEDGASGENKTSEGFGLEDGTGDKDVSDKLESEDQLDVAKKPNEINEKNDKDDNSCDEEKGIDMSEDFESKLQDMEKRDNGSDDSDNDSDDNEEVDKQMGETMPGADTLDDQIWGSDEEKDDDENEENGEMNEDKNGGGSNEEDIENDASNQKENSKQNDDNQQSDGLDAGDEENQEKKKTEKNELDKMDESETGEEQQNPFHNDLEEPPEPLDIDLSDNVKLDEDDANDNETNNEENPFDIDKMKEQMEINEDEELDENGDKETDLTDKKNDGDDDSSSEDDELKLDNENIDKNDNDDDDGDDVDQNKNEDTGINTQPDGNEEDENLDAEEDLKTNENEEHRPSSNDKPTENDKSQSVASDHNKDSVEQAEQTTDPKSQQQNEEIDAQETGEDMQAIGQAKNEKSNSGHQGVSDTKENQTSEKQEENQRNKEKHKQGKANEQRALDNSSKKENKQLKTIDKINENNLSELNDNDEIDEENTTNENEEYQHVKEAKSTDKSTLDSATEDQSSKQVHENEIESPEDQNDENNVDELPVDDDEAMDTQEIDDVEQIKNEKLIKKSEKLSSKERNLQTGGDQKEEIEIEGEKIDTENVLRSSETSAHCVLDILRDTSLPTEPSAIDILDMKKMVEKETVQNKMIIPGTNDFNTWHTISNKMLPNARELCEQLRLILEPTKCTRLKGDYRTGRRINMKKIIPYIASQFRKDKIWLRRTKPAQRDYKITIAIDDSKSMHHNQSKTLTLEAISLVSQALTLLESGYLNIVSFGEAPTIILNQAEQFDGPKLVKSLNFEQNQSRIAELLQFICVSNSEGRTSSDNKIFENLLLILSDGRNIFCEGEQHVKNSIKLARLQQIFIVYIIIDNPENKHSILDIRVPSFSSDRASISMKSYLDMFPFPYYVIVRDLSQLPLILSDAMRQWFELVNSEN